jgi:hypothetical protein
MRRQTRRVLLGRSVGTSLRGRHVAPCCGVQLRPRDGPGTRHARCRHPRKKPERRRTAPLGGEWRARIGGVEPTTTAGGHSVPHRGGCRPQRNGRGRGDPSASSRTKPMLDCGRGVAERRCGPSPRKRPGINGVRPRSLENRSGWHRFRRGQGRTSDHHRAARACHLVKWGCGPAAGASWPVSGPFARMAGKAWLLNGWRGYRVVA